MSVQEVEQIKAKYVELGIQGKLTDTHLVKLIEIANKHLEEQLAGESTPMIKCQRFPKEIGTDDKKTIRILCDGSYFEEREAYTFYPSGEVGIAGWASGHFYKIFATAFSEWCNWVAVQ